MQRDEISRTNDFFQFYAMNPGAFHITQLINSISEIFDRDNERETHIREDRHYVSVYARENSITPDTHVLSLRN